MPRLMQESNRADHTRWFSVKVTPCLERKSELLWNAIERCQHVLKEEFEKFFKIQCLYFTVTRRHNSLLIQCGDSIIHSDAKKWGEFFRCTGVLLQLAVTIVEVPCPIAQRNDSTAALCCSLLLEKLNVTAALHVRDPRHAEMVKLVFEHSRNEEVSVAFTLTFGVPCSFIGVDLDMLKFSFELSNDVESLRNAVKWESFIAALGFRPIIGEVIVTAVQNHGFSL